MTLASKFRAVAALARDVFRQSRSTKLYWLMLAASAICILVCLSVSIKGSATLKPAGSTELVGPDDKPISAPGTSLGELSLGFGLFRLNFFRDAPSEIHFIQVLLAKWVAGVIGTWLALIWTAGFLPEALRPGTVDLALVKPISRRLFLFGKYLGVMAFLTFQAGFFIFGTWLALGMRTGVWNRGYLLALPILLAHFAVVYSASVLLAVCTRNTVVCAMGSLLFWGICFGLNFGRHSLAALETAAKPNASGSRLTRGLVEVAYWSLPKPADLLIVMDRALDAEAHFKGFETLEKAGATTAFPPAWSIASSILFALVGFALSAREFALTDY